MTGDIQQNIETLVKSAENIWIPRWFELFSNANGGFHERIDKDGNSVDIPRRLLSQCRQIVVYSMAPGDAYREKLDEAFDFVQNEFLIPETGGSVFSLNGSNDVHDHTYDLYAHAFILLSCAKYYDATKNDSVLKYAKTTLNFINDKFALERGYAESLDSDLNPIPTIRRQNPHMHLLEGCIAMFEASQDNDYRDMADELVSLFFDNFFDEETGTLGEFFDNNLHPHPQEGHKVEAGHHAEWVWLLSQYQKISDKHSTKIDDAKERLFTFVINHGIDKNYGGIFNVQAKNGKIIDDHKRIWAALEALRAAHIMRRHHKFEKDAEQTMSALLDIIRNNYVDTKTGNWNEILDKDLQPITDYLPATTPYHIYPILKEIL